MYSYHHHLKNEVNLKKAISIDLMVSPVKGVIMSACVDSHSFVGKHKVVQEGSYF